MWNHLYRLQQKPEYIRRRILLVSTCVLTVIIIGIWFSTSGPYFDTELTSPSANSNTKTTAPPPFTAMSDTFSEFFSDAGSIVDLFKGGTASGTMPTATDTAELE